MKPSKLRTLCGLFALLFCVTALFSCSSESEGTKPSAVENSEKTELPPEEPAQYGVGRVVPVEVVQRDWLICVDPGHGFDDPGTGPALFAAGTYEREITIAVARYLKTALEERGFNVVLTHDGITMPSNGDWNGDNIFSAPYERPGYINTYVKPDYLVSLHVNAVEANPYACGIVVYYSQSGYKVNEWSHEAGQSIVDAITASDLETTAITKLTNDKETADASFAINRETNAASSLIEMGFCTNEADAEHLQDPAWQEQLAEAIANGIEAFFDVIDASAA
jgi:N-acetylmuramoyl-L-alanine amidase